MEFSAWHDKVGQEAGNQVGVALPGKGHKP